MTEFEKFKAEAEADIHAYRDKPSTKDTFSFSEYVKLLEQLQNKMSGHTLMHMFGDQLGMHLWEKFVVGHSRNLISWFNGLTSEYRFYILHQLKNDPYIFIH